MLKEGKVLLPAITKDRVYPQGNDPKWDDLAQYKPPG